MAAQMIRDGTPNARSLLVTRQSWRGSDGPCDGLTTKISPTKTLSSRLP
jgi:hypothetical protein